MWFLSMIITQHCLLIVSDKWCQCLDKGGTKRSTLTDFSKLFDCFLLDLLIGKLASYDLEKGG